MFGPQVPVLLGTPDFSPYRLPGLEAAYDFTDITTLKADASNRVSFAADKSGNSAAMGLVSPGTASNSAGFTALTAPGTGDFTLMAVVNAAAVNASITMLGGAANSCGFFINASGFAQTSLAGIGNNTASTTALSALTRYTLHYVRSGTTGTYYVNGVAAGTTADSRNYSVGNNAIGLFNGTVFSVRVYSAALSAGAVALDASGTVQANCIFDCDFTAQARGTSSFTSGTRGGATGVTVTITTSGDLGARICGARDLAMVTGSKQPLCFPWSGRNYLYTPAVIGNNATTPDAAANRFSSSLDLDVELSMDDWTPSSEQYVLAKDSNTANSRAYNLGVTPSGTIDIGLFDTAANSLGMISTAAPTVADGQRIFIRCKVTWALSGNVTADFYTSPDGATWTPLGTQKTIASTGNALAAGNTPVYLGQRQYPANESPLAGKIYSARIYSGDRAAGGTLKLQFIADQAANNASSVTSATGEVWTVNSTGGKPAQIVGAQSLLFDGVSYYLKTPPFAINQPASYVVTARQNAWTSGNRITDGNANGFAAIYQFSTTPNIGVFAGNDVGANGNLPLKTIGIIQAVINGASSLSRINRTTAVAGNAGASNPGGLTVGGLSDGSGNFGAIQCARVFVFSRALDISTLDKIALWAGRLDGVTV